MKIGGAKSSPQMLLQTRPLTSASFFSPSQFIATTKPPPPNLPCLRINNTSFNSIKCSAISTAVRTPLESSPSKPLPAEVSRTIMELSSSGTLSTLTPDGCPLGIGVRFAVDSNGNPVLCFDQSKAQFPVDRSSSLHVQLKQCGLRTPQCTLQGTIAKPEDKMSLKRIHSAWTKRFGKEVEEDLLYYVAVDRVLQIDDFEEDGIWISSSDYGSAIPDPLGDAAERIVSEINTHNAEDIDRFCKVYVDFDFGVVEAKMLWVDRLGFDVRVRSLEGGIFEARIPFPREVSDEKGAKSSFNCMSQTAWEVEKHFHGLECEKVKHYKRVC